MIKKILLTVISLFIANIFLNAGETEDLASYYADSFEGKITRNGEIFSNSNLTCASNSYKMGTKLKVTNIKNNKSIIVRVNDTGKMYGRKVDLSQKAFSSIGELSKGILKVKIEVIE